MLSKPFYLMRRLNVIIKRPNFLCSFRELRKCALVFYLVLFLQKHKTLRQDSQLQVLRILPQSWAFFENIQNFQAKPPTC